VIFPSWKPGFGASATGHPHDNQAIRQTPQVRYFRCEDRPLPALISSPLRGVFDVASVWFSLRRGRVISSGVFDVVGVADADPEVNGSRVTFAQSQDVRSMAVVGREPEPAQGGPGVTLGLERCHLRRTLRRQRTR